MKSTRSAIIEGCRQAMEAASKPTRIRADGPKAESTMRIEDGRKIWRLPNGLCHREDGPAVEWPDGTKEWYQHGRYHRKNGPAVELADGSKKWFLHGQLHRRAGPAIKWADGRKEWWLNGVRQESEKNR